MKILLLFISFAFLSVSSDTRLENTTLSTNDEIAMATMNTDLSENVIGEIHEHEADSEDCMCCNCSVYTVSCWPCGHVITFQWYQNCFHGTWHEFKEHLCDQACM